MFATMRKSAPTKVRFFDGARPGAFAGRAPNFPLYHIPHILSSKFCKKIAQILIPKFVYFVYCI